MFVMSIIWLWSWFVVWIISHTVSIDGFFVPHAMSIIYMLLGIKMPTGYYNMGMSVIDDFLRRNSKYQANISVVGDGMVDEYFQTNAERVSPEFPIPVMQRKDEVPNRACPGGAGNVCTQFKHFNVNVSFFGFLDSSSVDLYELAGISTKHSKRLLFPSSIPYKKRYYQGNFPLCRLDIEKHNYGLSVEELDKYCQELYERYLEVDKQVVILSDYGKGIFNENIERWMKEESLISIVDPKKGPVSRWKGCSVIKPNSKEAETLSGLLDWRQQCDYFQRETQCMAVVITQEGHGVVGKVFNSFFEYKAKKTVHPNSVIGAGDCFVAVLAMALAHSIDIVDAIELAFEAGAVYVERKYNQPITPRELLGRFDSISAKIVNRNEDLSFLIGPKKIGFTSGAFDILHAGHVDFLRRAKELCDILVVGVNSDISVKTYKGANRPIIPEQERIKVIASLDCVDYAFLFNERRNRINLEVLKPDLYIKAGDYEEDELTSRDALEGWGGKVVILPLVEGFSSSNVIAKIKNSSVENVKKKKPAIFLDRDGTINKWVPYLHEPEKLEILPGVMDSVKELYNMQYSIVVVTNQPGISLGYFQKEDVFVVNSEMLKKFKESDVLIERIYFCPHSDADKCDCRKPKPGLLKRAESELGIDMEHSFMIGDAESDIEAGIAAGVKTILVNENLPMTKANHKAKCLHDAVEWIKAQEN